MVGHRPPTAGAPPGTCPVLPPGRGPRYYGHHADTKRREIVLGQYSASKRVITGGVDYY